MVASILSLIKHLKNTYCSRLLKCVSPLLMGAVLALSIPGRVFAAEDGELIHSRGIFGENVAFEVSTEVNEVVYSDIFHIDYYKDASIAELPMRYKFEQIYIEVPYDYLRQSYEYEGQLYETYSQLDITDITLHLFINGREFILNPLLGSNYETVIGEYPNRKKRLFFANTDMNVLDMYFNAMSSGLCNTYCFFEFVNFNDYYKLNSSNQEYVDGRFLMSVSMTVYLYKNSSGVSDVDLYNPTNDLIHDGNVQAQERWEEDRFDAEQAGSDMSGFASQLDNLKNTWAILWYPIEFTNRFVEVFTGGTQAAAYQDEYTYVTGFRYNDETGFLEPIQSMAAQPQSAGTGITFPSFELMGYTIWESYTYDLSQVKDQLPEVFDAIYVFVSILEMLWFVGFLRNKYNEVFG